MCEHKKNIIFCTCNEKESNDALDSKVESFEVIGNQDDYNKRVYYWILKRTIRKRTDKEQLMIIGELFQSFKKLDEELIAEFVVEQLNKNAEFDFDYKPEDGDELLIGVDYKYVQFKDYSRPSLPIPMTFVYENKEWCVGYVNHFEYKKIELNKGKIKLHNNMYST